MIIPSLDVLYDDGLALLDLEARCEAEDLQPGGIRHWRTIIGDLARLRAGWRPDDALLAKAPSLSGWGFAGHFDIGLVQLTGTVVGHPRIPDARLVRTSMLLALDTRNVRWARTLSRFYVLRDPWTPPPAVS